MQSTHAANRVLQNVVKLSRVLNCGKLETGKAKS